jgi:hypothetical protein
MSETQGTRPLSWYAEQAPNELWGEDKEDKMEIMQMTRTGRPREDTETKFWKYVDKKANTECWLWKGATTYGRYGKLGVDGVSISTHRYAWELSRKCKVPEGKMILHTCDNSLCCNPSHLYCGTQSNNMCDRFERNRVDLSLCASSTRFYEGEVWLMKKLYNAGISQHKICLMFKASPSTVSNWVRGKLRYAKPNPA